MYTYKRLNAQDSHILSYHVCEGGEALALLSNHKNPGFSADALQGWTLYRLQDHKVLAEINTPMSFESAITEVNEIGIPDAESRYVISLSTAFGLTLYTVPHNYSLIGDELELSSHRDSAKKYSFGEGSALLDRRINRLITETKTSIPGDWFTHAALVNIESNETVQFMELSTRMDVALYIPHDPQLGLL